MIDFWCRGHSVLVCLIWELRTGGQDARAQLSNICTQEIEIA